ncbi:carbohydrate binding family 9 domain-containing protein [Pseudoalteromonas sp. MT33b]|uniref:carbohydrate binding family 9 domain-containing protein n=1 Tax=Pseudoalteromonas sp. MT33b TaxID=2759705 RepID=UPI0015FAE17C|nr:carbohydrate binding family 9 domain-containing protein [Pseudoalteromonas sp. MT33b]QMW16895.1 carbohydrate binding family 9 domain-containing protein [Pseudoalteromonas sp. MT33b]
MFMLYLKKIITRVVKSCLIFSCVSISSLATASDKVEFALAHIKESISVDGVMDEAHWQQATKVPLKYQNEPNEKGTPPVHTDAYLYEDGQYLYVGFIAKDPDPSQIRAALRDRDTLWQDDNVALMIDTFNDERTGYEFYVNPLGAQGDMRMTDIDDWVEDPSWDAIWDSAGQITDEGYVVEMRIPFTALRFPKGKEQLTWSLAVWRNYPRDVFYQMSNVGFDRDVKCSFCQFDKLTGFADMTQSMNIQLTPTLTALRNDTKNTLPGDWQNGDVDTEAGLDLRWGVTQDAVINATINPDFSQVEADSLELDVNTTYSIYYAEKRPFFLDGASYFKTSQFELLYTRTIAEPDVGVKLTGKTGNHSYGFIYADDDNTSVLLPTNQGSYFANLGDKTHAAVGRYQFDIGQKGTIGVMSTHRENDDYHNSVLSLDGSYWFNQTDSLQYQVATTDTKNSDFLVDVYGLEETQSDQAYKVEFSRTKRDYELYASYENIGEEYRSDLGYQAKVDYKQAQLGGGQTWYRDADDIVTEYSYNAEWDKTWAQNGDLLEEEYDGFFTFKGKMQSQTEIGFIHRNEFYAGQFFNQNIAYIYGGFRPIRDIRFLLYAQYGSKIDYSNAQLGTMVRVEPEMTWDINDHWQVQLEHSYSYLDNEQNERVYTVNLTDLRVYYKFNMRSMLKLVLQFKDIDRDRDAYFSNVSEINRDFASQLVYSYKINSQTLFYLGYSDKGYQDDSLKELERDQRTFFTKLSYAWQL